MCENVKPIPYQYIARVAAMDFQMKQTAFISHSCMLTIDSINMKN